ncbi:HAMP domain-containing histidine kinase [Roseomonas sp. NAR14]|uniref:histidine kinase n=1 Tax=Roseomonas acroporae TaxID=2937791 RepID=A0A9X1Y6P9_9PROT|nr:HAMP domain-containing sensor histidine kinase [Roseomonas acroporae]MCK8784491.1 HAMP domain-containing histidine kinase [Roseomonas acroporae]
MNAVQEAQKDRELAYYRRECNVLGSRLLRLQEEQSQAYREARRSRTVAKLLREAYRLIHLGYTPGEIGRLMLDIIVDNAMCDRAALLQELVPGSGDFRIAHALGLGDDAVGARIRLASAPPFFFTTSRTRIEPPVYELTSILRLPYVLWAYDAASGHALILGNETEGNVSRPFEEGDQELVEGALSVYIDVLVRKQAEADLMKAKLLAEEASSTRSRFLATLTHELRTPLNAVIGFSEMMSRRSGYSLTEEQFEEFNSYILGSARQLLSLINEILDYSSLSRAGVALSCAWEDLAYLLAEAAGAASGVGADRAVAVVPTVPAERIWVWVDRVRFRQILDNLLSNAVRFSHAGGTVSLRTAQQAPSAPQLPSAIGGPAPSAIGAPAPSAPCGPTPSALCIEVRDEGIGMSEADIPRVLEPFQQAGNVLERRAGGTGLGLPIAKGLAEAHGIGFELESRPGAGTTVRLVLPAGLFVIGTDRPTAPPRDAAR